MRTHAEIEARSLAMHRLVAEKIRCDRGTLRERNDALPPERRQLIRSGLGA